MEIADKLNRPARTSASAEQMPRLVKDQHVARRKSLVQIRLHVGGVAARGYAAGTAKRENKCPAGAVARHADIPCAPVVVLRRPVFGGIGFPASRRTADINHGRVIAAVVQSLNNALRHNGRNQRFLPCRPSYERVDRLDHIGVFVIRQTSGKIASDILPFLSEFGNQPGFAPVEHIVQVSPQPVHALLVLRRALRDMRHESVMTQCQSVGTILILVCRVDVINSHRLLLFFW